VIGEQHHAIAVQLLMLHPRPTLAAQLRGRGGEEAEVDGLEAAGDRELIDLDGDWRGVALVVERRGVEVLGQDLAAQRLRGDHRDAASLVMVADLIDRALRSDGRMLAKFQALARA
jgi:hypothetical protein